MAQITIDTEKDSAASMKKMIQLLEHFIAEKGDEPILTNAPSTNQNNNPFALFGETENSQTTVSEQSSHSTSTAAHNQDMFSMFSNDTPSSTPQSYGSTPTTISSSGMSAQDLLSESTQEREEEPKKDQDFFQLMHY